jgi:hypothetical protein
MQMTVINPIKDKALVKENVTEATKDENEEKDIEKQRTMLREN